MKSVVQGAKALKENKNERELRYFKECLELENIEYWEQYANGDELEWEICNGRFHLNATYVVPINHLLSSTDENGIKETEHPYLIDVLEVTDYEGEILDLDQDTIDLILKKFNS